LFGISASVLSSLFGVYFEKRTFETLLESLDQFLTILPVLICIALLWSCLH